MLVRLDETLHNKKMNAIKTGVHSNAGCATGTLALARRAEQRDLLDASADVAEVGLTEGEAQQLLGGRD
jgi:hypothetical protein